MSLNVKKARWVRKLNNGAYTMESTDVLASTQLICKSCGIYRVCPIHESMERFAAIADITVRNCRKYVPLLLCRRPFTESLKDEVIVLRRGTGLHELLHDGRELVALTDRFSETVFAFYSVTKLTIVNSPDELLTLLEGLDETKLLDEEDSPILEQPDSTDWPVPVTVVLLQRMENEGLLGKMCRR
ncbi:hypothetical protein [Oceanimonas sp. CAM02]|jgi:hypothetical protein|uniref:hypothetical protein n=1 Tax=Oceanimonas sp. CAM02 TaxID=3080336 RepID=UPI00293534D2|nr:hypothetical protein [Oceanimonas sp. CAM02]MDV2858279.1 hypothetical protein [Oceanimonas sp. CAM02]